MTNGLEQVTRRDFLRWTGALGLGAALTASGAGALLAQGPKTVPPAAAVAAAAPELVPTRPFGRTGVQVPILSMGMMFDTITNQLLLKRAMTLGVRHWDTADCYQGGDSEKGIGKYFGRFPEDRDKVFLVTKSDERGPAGMHGLLTRSLERLKTDRIDLYLVHAVSDITELDERMKAYVEKVKAEGKIRFFGLSTHKSEPEVLQGAARLGWVDGILVSYNVEQMQKPEMKDAVQACYDAGIGMTAMKTGRGELDLTKKGDRDLVQPHLDKGFSEAQARVLAVLSDTRISGACLTLKNLELLETNTAAALGRPTL